MASILSIITFHLLADPQKAEKLKRELGEAYGTSNEFLSYHQLQHLPYLTAIITEGTRLNRESGRMPRINPHAPTYWKSWTIPAGTLISMSIRDIHLNDSIFENANTFQPDRWLDPINKANLEHFLVPFGRGSRSCVGMNFSMVELYLTIGNLFRRMEMQLYDTTEEMVYQSHDFLAPHGPRDSKGLRVLIVCSSVGS